MYLPDHFAETEQDEILRLIETHPFAAVVANGPSGFICNHFPVLLEDNERLIGHLARANSMHLDVENGAGVLAVFNGEDSYISPNWYPTKAENHKSVPTWNYQIVHVHGKIQFSHDEKTKRKVVGRLTTYFERSLNGDSAWRMSDAPADFMLGKLNDIVAFEITIERIEAKSKLNQNRAKIDFDSVHSVMESSGKAELAVRMAKLQKQ